MIPIWLSLMTTGSKHQIIGGGGGGPSGGCSIAIFRDLTYTLPPARGFYCQNTLRTSDAGTTGNPQPIPYGGVTTGGMEYTVHAFLPLIMDGYSCVNTSCTLPFKVDVGAAIQYTQQTSWGETQNAGLNLGTLWRLLTGSTFGVNKFSVTACTVAVSIPAVTQTIWAGSTVVFGYAVPTITALEVQVTNNGNQSCIGTRTSIVTGAPINFNGVGQYGQLYDSCAETWSGTGCTNTITPCVTSVSKPG